MHEIQDDFNPKEEIRKVAANLEQPHKFAQIFHDAAKNQKLIDDTLKEVIKSLIYKDKDVKKYIKSMIREVDKEDWLAFWRKIGFALWSIIMLMGGAIISALGTKFIGK